MGNSKDLIYYEEQFGRLRKNGRLIKEACNVEEFVYFLMQTTNLGVGDLQKLRSWYLKEGYDFGKEETRTLYEDISQEELRREEDMEETWVCE